MNIVNTSPKKQQGATLVFSLLMLIIMTIVGVSAVKVGSSDILIAGNDQRAMTLYQTTESRLVKLASSIYLLPAMVTGVDFTLYDVPDAPVGFVEKIKDSKKRYDCQGSDGRAMSIGTIGSTECRIYEFQISAKSGYGKEIGRRGAGKVLPDDGNVLER